MTTRRRPGPTPLALAVAVLFAVLGAAFGPAVPAAAQQTVQQGAMPADFRAAIDAVASYNQYGHALETRVARNLQNRPLSAQYQQQSRARTDAQMASTVVELIERRPDLARSLVAYAGQVSPQSAAYVRQSAASAFPALGIGEPFPAALAQKGGAPAPSVADAYPDWYEQPQRRTVPRYTSTVRAPRGQASPPLTDISPEQDGFGIPAYMAGAYDRPANLLGTNVVPPAPVSVTPLRSRYSYDIDYGNQSAAAPAPAQAPVAAPAARQQRSRFSYDVDYSGTAPSPTYPPAQTYPSAGGGQQVAVRSEAPAGSETIEPDVLSDPLEPMNRAIFAVNDVLDQVLFRPLAKLYSFTPLPVRASMRRFFANLNEPLIAVNDTLQLDLADAGTAVGRFAVNSTVGVLGLFDPATAFGMEAHHADFGQTLHSYGMGAGPYLVLPILGPSNARDTVGRVGDIFLDPLTYALWDEDEIRLGLLAGNLLVKREELLEPLDDLRASSVDYYAAARGAYYQNRAVELAKGRANVGNKALDRLFDELE